MKQHTNAFKTNLKELGRELRGVITYDNTTLEDEILSITPHFNADLLKSVMKQLDLELYVDIPLETIINCQIGILVNEQYEMLNFGNYVVYKSEKQEDTGTYKIVCYDKMLYSMKQNEDLGITYPITIKNYLNALASKIGLSVVNTTFYNQDMQIPSELYVGLEYTYRDILDEIAEATGSIICLDETDKILVKYPTLTNDTIDEEFLKDVNVNFGQKFGVINSVVLSRAGESDNVYLRDEESVDLNGLTEVKIVDNQIMNFNNRSEYLQGILNALNGLYYYINDFNSTGILYYEVGDLYNVQIGENTYQCLMLNDEIKVTTGIEELVHTDLPQQSETDYQKADKTDMKINQTYLIVNKQNQIIEGVIENVTAQNNKIAQMTVTVDELNSKIQDIADITTYGESDGARVVLENINTSEPVMIKVHPTTETIKYIYPKLDLYPSETQFMQNRNIRFTRTYTEDGQTKTQNIDYEIPSDLLRYSNEIYDEFYLNYESQTCQVIKRCGLNSDGTVYILDNEQIIDFPYPTIELEEGDYTISLPNYNFGYLFVRLVAKNIYTTQFYTKVETNAKINEKANEIELGINQTLTNYSTTNQMNASINLKANEIINSVSSNYETKDSAVTNYTRLQQTDTEINRIVGTKVGENEVISKINQSSEAVTILANKLGLTANDVLNIIAGSTINMTTKNLQIKSDNFNVDKNGNMSCNNATMSGKITSNDGKIGNWTINNSGLTNGTVFLHSDGSSTIYTVADLIIVRGYIMGTPGFELSNAMIRHYDFNNDGRVSSSDYVTLQNLIGIQM